MKTGIIKLTAACLILFLSILAPAQTGGNFTITESVIAGGGGTNSSGGDFSLAGTIGQPLAGNALVGDPYAVTSGFWNFTPSAPATTGNEGDVSTRPNGDLTPVDLNDVLQTTRFAVCSDTAATSPNEVQRADTSPRNAMTGTYGDGVIDLNDVLQTTRYAVFSDPNPTAAAGPTTNAMPCGAPAAAERQSGQVLPTVGKDGQLSNGVAAPALPRRLIVQSAISSSPNRVRVAILVDAEGNEAGYQFRVNFPAPLTIFSTTITGTSAMAGSRTCNTATAGQANCIVTGFPDDRGGDPNIGEIAPGNNQQLLFITFNIPAGVAPQAFNITLTNISTSTDAPATITPTPDAVNGTLTVTGPTAATASVGGQVLTNNGRGLMNATVLLTDQSGNTRETRTSTFGYYRFEGVEAGQTYILNVRSKRYQFTPQVMSVAEDLVRLNFVAQ